MRAVCCKGVDWVIAGDFEAQFRLDFSGGVGAEVQDQHAAFFGIGSLGAGADCDVRVWLPVDAHAPLGDGKYLFVGGFEDETAFVHVTEWFGFGAGVAGFGVDDFERGPGFGSAVVVVGA